jgi:[acyl-carrier-protein] S-malonyltransferase
MGSILKNMKAYIFPGQGAQFSGMGKDLYQQFSAVKKMMDAANVILDFDLSKVMFEGTAEDLKQTQITQPAIFLHSVAMVKALGGQFKPQMVAGHSLGEFSALVANGALAFQDALKLVYQRALAMQEACDKTAGTMAAVLGLDDAVVARICEDTPGVVVAANYNCPGQLVISGSIIAVETACEALKAAGAKRALLLPVGGAFHSPLMEPARAALEAAIKETHFSTPNCPIYQNVSASAVLDSDSIKSNLIDQLTTPVKWTQSIESMVADGATHFIELGPGKVLQGLVKKIAPEALCSAPDFSAQ